MTERRPEVSTQRRTNDAKYVDHDLPMLRVHRALERAGKEHEGAVRETIAVLGEGTRRIGLLCPECWEKVAWHSLGSYAICGDHGRVEPALAIAFPPVSYDHE